MHITQKNTIFERGIAFSDQQPCSVRRGTLDIRRHQHHRGRGAHREEAQCQNRRSTADIHFYRRRKNLHH